MFPDYIFDGFLSTGVRLFGCDGGQWVTNQGLGNHGHGVRDRVQVVAAFQCYDYLLDNINTLIVAVADKCYDIVTCKVSLNRTYAPLNGTYTL